MDCYLKASLHVEETDLLLNFNVSALDFLTIPDDAVLHYVHSDYNSTNYILLDLPPPESIRISDQSAGVIHSFTLALSLCELTLAFSPLVSNVIPPNPPTDVAVDLLFDTGFRVFWNLPNIETDPLVEDYKYVVKVWSNETAREDFKYTVQNVTSFSVFSLIPETHYFISVISSPEHNKSSITSFDKDSRTCVYKLF